MVMGSILDREVDGVTGSRSVMTRIGKRGGTEMEGVDHGARLWGRLGGGGVLCE